MSQSLKNSRDLRHHAFVISAEAEEGIEMAQAWAERELSMTGKNNPDIAVLRHGLFSVDDARRVYDIAGQAPFFGDHKVILISASRAYHEAQNALLKLFEEPPPGTYLFLILPTLGGLLPTLRSRVQVLDMNVTSHTSGMADEFMKATKEKRSTIIKKLTSGKDEEERRELREEAIAIMNEVEAVAYQKLKKNSGDKAVVALLSDIATFRGYLHDRSAPVRMILEHLSLVIPKGLV